MLAVPIYKAHPFKHAKDPFKHAKDPFKNFAGT